MSDKIYVLKEPPKVKYRVRQRGIENCFQPQYKSGLKWKDFTERKYDPRDGESFESRIQFSTLDKANEFIDKEIESKTITTYYR